MKRRQVRKTRKQRKSKRSQRFLSRKRRYRGGANLPVPEGAVVSAHLDPTDPYSLPVFVSKAKYENEVLEN